jgi:C-terminal processing protease CtpA/Prc
MKILTINGKNIDTVMKQFLSIEPADGYNITSKYHWLEGAAFARHYAVFFEENPKEFNMELEDNKSGKKIVYRKVPACNYKQTDSINRKYAADNSDYIFKDAAAFKIDSAANTAVLTVNTFNTDKYKGGRNGFKQFLKNSFSEIAKRNIGHLIIDVRKNEGGAQGMEDHLLSYLITGNYEKYKYVEIPGFAFSFSQYTDIKEKEAREDLEKDLKEYFHRADDGRYTDIPGMYKGDSAQENNFKGDLYILISGLTFSGGSEFAALAKNYTAAKFIGEETGGGYYGNTSGNFLQFTLPNSQLTGRIPICKFVIVPKDFGISFGHGVMPDFPVHQTIVEYFSGYDPEMNLAKEMILKK